jgi:hypothetical protein
MFISTSSFCSRITPCIPVVIICGAWSALKFIFNKIFFLDFSFTYVVVVLFGEIGFTSHEGTGAF